jgi:tRNA-2-methylthio-N6-dimethylallyladenosine synthase
VRSETKAAGFPDDLPYPVKLERLNRLQSLQKQVTLKHNKRFAGTLQEVLVEGKSKRGDQLFGRTDTNRMVHFTADPSLISNLVTLKIVKAKQNSLLGELP